MSGTSISTPSLNSHLRPLVAAKDFSNPIWELTPFMDLVMPDKYEWDWEREWRVRGDVDFTLEAQRSDEARARRRAVARQKADAERRRWEAQAEIARRKSDERLKDLAGWATAGIPVERVRDWTAAGFAPASAQPWAEAGYVPRLARSFSEAGFSPSDGLQWTRAGLSGQQARRAVTEGLSPEGARRDSSFNTTQRACPSCGRVPSLHGDCACT